MRKELGSVLTVWMKECLPVEWVCAREKWYNIQARHERRNAHAEVE